MIPRANIIEWSRHAPWPTLAQIEQDLIICRALCAIFNDPFLASRLAFRGGTAINKLLFTSPLRYSEDIDLVQTRAEPIGPTIDAMRMALSWLGNFNRKQTQHSTHLLFKFQPEDGAELSLMVEMNTREHSYLLPLKKAPFEISNSWFSGKTNVSRLF